MIVDKQEVASGARFEFGNNWRKFLALLTEERIAEAEKSLQQKVGVEHLQSQSFLDIGSGSGLFSLAARRLGARVHSFDYDAQAVGCAVELRRRYFPDESTWTVEQGSALDAVYLSTLGTFDVVYSWGVLHHTGAMWQALANAALPVAENGQLFIAIYNDQGMGSRGWWQIKRAYNKLPRPLRFLILWPSTLWFLSRSLAKDVLHLKAPFYHVRAYKLHNRGMSFWRDVVDWVGGYPFEVAKPEEIFDFYLARGFTLEKLTTCAGGHGCNEFVFRRARKQYMRSGGDGAQDSRRASEG